MTSDINSTDAPQLAFLDQFKAGGLKPGYGDLVLLFVGVDDCHGALAYIIPKEESFYRENMYSYDDQALNDAIVSLMENPSVHVQLSLDKSQSGNKTETGILQADQKLDPTAYQNDIVIGDSSTDQISHTKGGVLQSLGIFFEGSMNWSTAGEGIGLILNGKPVLGLKAQNNTLLFSTNIVALTQFAAELDKEHQTMIEQNKV
jgi:hypothetical protein